MEEAVTVASCLLSHQGVGEYKEQKAMNRRSDCSIMLFAVT